MSIIRISKVKGRLVFLLLLALLIMTGPVSASNPADPTHPNYSLYKEIENSLMCTDGCGMALIACDNITAAQMREEIRQFINEGQTRDEILQSFVDIYGVEVLTYPPKQGFNISAWVTPFIAILMGGLGIYLALDKWVFTHEENDLEEGEEKKELDESDLSQYDDILEKERKKYF